MEGGKTNRYAALQGGDGGSKFCQKVRYVTVERSLRTNNMHCLKNEVSH